MEISREFINKKEMGKIQFYCNKKYQEFNVIHHHHLCKYLFSPSDTISDIALIAHWLVCKYLHINLDDSTWYAANNNYCHHIYSLKWFDQWRKYRFCKLCEAMLIIHTISSEIPSKEPQRASRNKSTSFVSTPFHMNICATGWVKKAEGAC